MSETCYVTEVRLLTALEPPAVSVAKLSGVSNKTRFSLASFSWPFLPQVPPSSSQECGTVGNLRFRRAGAAVAPPITSSVSTVTPLAKLHLKPPLSIELSAWTSLLLLLLKGLRSKLAVSILNILVIAALAALIIEALICLVSIIIASKVPPGLVFMIAALVVLGFVAVKAISYDSASIQRRKSTLALLRR